MWAILDKVVDDHVPVLEGLEHDVEEVETTAFSSSGRHWWMPSANAWKAGKCARVDSVEEVIESALGVRAAASTVDGADGLLERPRLGDDGIACDSPQSWRRSRWVSRWRALSSRSRAR